MNPPCPLLNRFLSPVVGSDALAGGGVRAIRYALEAGPVEVVAIDHSKEACEGKPTYIHTVAVLRSSFYCAVFQ